MRPMLVIELRRGKLPECRHLFMAAVLRVECNFPGLAPVARDLNYLMHFVGGDGSERRAVQMRSSVEMRNLSLEAHSPVLVLFHQFFLFHGSRRSDPNLFPLAGGLLV